MGFKINYKFTEVQCIKGINIQGKWIRWVTQYYTNIVQLNMSYGLYSTNTLC